MNAELTFFSWMLIFTAGAAMVISTIQYAVRLIQRNAYLVIVLIALAIALTGYFCLPSQPADLQQPGQPSAVISL